MHRSAKWLLAFKNYHCVYHTILHSVIKCSPSFLIILELLTLLITASHTEPWVHTWLTPLALVWSLRGSLSLVYLLLSPWLIFTGMWNRPWVTATPTEHAPFITMPLLIFLVKSARAISCCVCAFEYDLDSETMFHIKRQFN